MNLFAFSGQASWPYYRLGEHCIFNSSTITFSRQHGLFYQRYNWM